MYVCMYMYQLKLNLKKTCCKYANRNKIYSYNKNNSKNNNNTDKPNVKTMS